MQFERDAMDDRYYSSSSSSSWRHPIMPWSRTCNTTDAGHNCVIHVGSTLGRFMPPRSCVTAGGRLPLPPPLLPLAGLRQTPAFNADVELQRVPMPTRADRLLVDRREEHAITVCFPRHSQSGATDVGEEVKPVMAPNDCEELEADSGVVSYRQRRRVDVSEAAPTANAASVDIRQPALSDRPTATNQGPHEQTGGLTKQSDARAGEVDGNSLAQTADNHIRPSVVHRRLLSASRCGWSTTAAARRRTVELDAKYWERRRKNNEAAKRSRDIRRANERRVALRAALLQRENEKLRAEVDTLTDDTLRLHYYLLCSRTFACTHCHRNPNE